jgi:hypothetical protein
MMVSKNIASFKYSLFSSYIIIRYSNLELHDQIKNHIFYLFI